MRASLAGLRDIAASFRRALDTGASALAARLTPRLRSALNVFEGASALVQYELSEAAFAAAAGGAHAFATEFLPVLSAMLAPLQYALTPSLAAALLLKVATYVAKQLEPRIRRKKFNLLGALQFEADVRALAGFFAARAGRRARERFARLAAIAALLACETPQEAADALRAVAGAGAGGAAAAAAAGGAGALAAGARLSADDAAAVLRQRTDLEAGARG